MTSHDITQRHTTSHDPTLQDRLYTHTHTAVLPLHMLAEHP